MKSLVRSNIRETSNRAIRKGRLYTETIFNFFPMETQFGILLFISLRFTFSLIINWQSLSKFILEITVVP